MNLKNKNIGFALTGAFYTFNKVIPKIKELVKKQANIIPIMSYNAYNIDTKIGKALDFVEKIEKITGNKIIHTIEEAEKLGVNKVIDIIVIAPTTGNTIAKLANGISDTPVLTAVMSNIRNNNPVVVAISSNNALSREC